MKTADIKKLTVRINKIRMRLGDMKSPPNQIWRPVGMRRSQFDNNIERLIDLEHKRAVLFATRIMETMSK